MTIQGYMLLMIVPFWPLELFWKKNNFVNCNCIFRKPISYSNLVAFPYTFDVTSAGHSNCNYCCITS